MAKTLTEVAKLVLMNEEVANQATLKPGSKHKEGEQKLGSVDKVADAPVKPGDGNNVGAAAATKGKDSTIPSKGGAEPMKKGASYEMMEEEADLDEEFELDEELAEFIDALVAEGLSEEEIMIAIDENFELIDEEVDAVEEEAEEVEEDTEELEESAKVELPEMDLSEDVNALLAGETLSEEFKEKATAIYEAAVLTRVQDEVAKIQEAYEAALTDEIDAIKAKLEEKVESYLDYVIEQWMEENAVAVESGLRNELTEDLVESLRNVLIEHYIDMPEEKVSVVEEMAAKIDELSGRLNEEIDRSVELNKMLSESRKDNIVNSLTEGLTATQAERVRALAENVAFTSDDEFARKVELIKESYVTQKTVKNDNVLDAVESNNDGKMIAEDSRVEKYLKAFPKVKK